MNEDLEFEKVIFERKCEETPGISERVGIDSAKRDLSEIFRKEVKRRFVI
jgi:hypothetical protein